MDNTYEVKLVVKTGPKSKYTTVVKVLADNFSEAVFEARRHALAVDPEAWDAKLVSYRLVKEAP